jgi:hypothetical protein
MGVWGKWRQFEQSFLVPNLVSNRVPGAETFEKKIGGDYYLNK